MHEFKIVHLDIKPENIVWSEHYQKAVFIDFGFSDIIKEERGFKSLCTFKGTPNFASP
jgi:serine/threonine protein kinase